MSFYDDPTSFPYIERAILTEDIKLPILNKKKKLTLKFLQSEPDIEYKLAYNEIKNVEAKFIVPVLMTNIVNNGQEVNTANRAPKTTGFIGNIRSLSYSSSNIVKLTIPKYMVFQFLDLKNETEGTQDPIIPKGTEFLVACVGGAMDLDHMRIIGIYTLTYDKSKFPNLSDDYYGGNPVQ